jgi:hypothetical protein
MISQSQVRSSKESPIKTIEEPRPYVGASSRKCHAYYETFEFVGQMIY